MGIGWGITFITALLSLKSLMPGDHSLTVTVNGLRNSKGLVQFALYDQADAFPDEDFENHYKLRKAEITDSSSQVTFHHIPSGRYAVSILHDENNNGTIDKGLMLPEEGIGFTNYESFGLGNKPGFSKASFELNKDKKIKVKVIYM